VTVAAVVMFIKTFMRNLQRNIGRWLSDLQTGEKV
jgi:hypothetical protein